MKGFLEADLYAPIHSMLTALGYDVKGEVKDCDMAGIKDGELIVVELKRGFSVELLFQAIRRQRTADRVYVGIPRPKQGLRGARWKDIVALAGRLGLGIIVVSFTGAGSFAQIALEPGEASVRKAPKKKREAIVAEHRGRTGDYNVGGAARAKLMTRYREQALQIAVLLEHLGEASPKALREHGACDKTPSILKANFYGWFQKKDRAVYALTGEGAEALVLYDALAIHYRSLIDLDAHPDTSG